MHIRPWSIRSGVVTGGDGREGRGGGGKLRGREQLFIIDEYKANEKVISCLS